MLPRKAEWLDHERPQGFPMCHIPTGWTGQMKHTDSGLPGQPEENHPDSDGLNII